MGIQLLTPGMSCSWQLLAVRHALNANCCYDRQGGITGHNRTFILNKNGDPKAALSIDSFYLFQTAFLRLAIPTRPSKPEPNSHTAAGTGTVVSNCAEAKSSAVAVSQLPKVVFAHVDK